VVAMRFFGVLALLASLWSLGCSAPPRSEELVAQEDEDPRVAWVEYAHTPDRHPAAAPSPDPEPQLSTPEPLRRAVGSARPKVSATFEDVDGTWMVETVSAVDMPAIDVETGIVVVPQLQILQLTTIVGWFEVSWLDPSGPDETLMLVDERGSEWLSRSEVRRRERDINAKLQGSSWRSMEQLAVELANDDWQDFALDEPPAERRVQAIMQHGELIVRIPGVRVLERHRLEHPRVMSLYRLYADRDSGTALAIFMDCLGDNCTCDPAFTAQVMRFDEATFAAIDRRPCTHCEPTDFGFNDVDPWG
jgi:hypothetical protein